LDAITGEGISNAMEQALLIDRLLGKQQGASSFDRLIIDYSAELIALMRNYYWFTKFTLLLHRRPLLVNQVVRIFQKTPWLFNYLLNFNASLSLSEANSHSPQIHGISDGNKLF
jgi:hypothetical protein